jgi:hypothetical protein
MHSAVLTGSHTRRQHLTDILNPLQDPPMTTTTTSTELQQLTAALTVLTEALARSERRHAHLVRGLRWGALTLSLLMISGAALFWGRFGAAYAESGSLTPTAEMAQALNQINANLALFGMMSQTMNDLVPAIQAAMMDNKDVRASVQAYLKGRGLPVTPDNERAYTAPVVVNNAMTTLVDTVILLQRIRGDSNDFRDLVGGAAPALRGVEQELKLMNAALTAVPAMAIQMDLMNRNMASMTYSMGSTMGRMGSWMP